MIDKLLFLLLKRQMKRNIDNANKILFRAKELGWLDRQEVINWQDELNKISIYYY